MYTIAGVTGNTGKVAANALLDSGQKVRVIVRDGAKGAAFAKRGAEVAVADLGDRDALASAFAGASGAYVLLPPNIASTDFRAYQDATSHAIASAVRSAGVPHVVLLSSVGAQLASGTGPVAGLHLTERLLSEIPGTNPTFVRAAYFMENVAGSFGALDKGVLPSFMPADLAVDMIATKDIGEAVATLLLEGPKDRVVNLAGPAHSYRDVAGLLTTILGKPIDVAEAPLDAIAPTLMGYGFSADMAGLYAEMIDGFAQRRIPWQKADRELKGKTSLETVLRGLLTRS